MIVGVRHRRRGRVGDLHRPVEAVVLGRRDAVVRVGAGDTEFPILSRQTQRREGVEVATDDRPLRPHSVLDRLRQLSDEADVPPVTVHDLRHLAATLTITAGVPLTVVSKTLRHSTLSTTANIYSHLTRQAAREAVDTIEQTLTRAEQNADRQARLSRLRSPRDHIQRLREALNRHRSPAPPGFSATASFPQIRPATTVRPPALQEREKPPSRKRENGFRPASKLVGTTGFEPATP
nr:tyrosine-type recombinase/integrase [Streptomyces regalis]